MPNHSTDIDEALGAMSTESLPFVLRFAEPVQHTDMPGYYDREKQIWISPESRVPPVTLRTSAPERTDEIDQGPGV